MVLSQALGACVAVTGGALAWGCGIVRFELEPFPGDGGLSLGGPLALAGVQAEADPETDGGNQPDKSQSARSTELPAISDLLPGFWSWWLSRVFGRR
jgi:hypothetical protein